MDDNIQEQSREIIEAGSRSFALAARLFKREVRDDVYLLYAWCRYCDDAIDGQVLGFDATPGTLEEQQSRLDDIHEQTRIAVDGGEVSHPAFRGLRDLVRRHAIPAHYPRELIEGFVMDVEGRRYETLEDTLLYCYHVAGVVGIMMAWVMGVRKREILCRAADLGIAFQLTNISRDIMDDARIHRVYLPAAWLRDAGVAPEEIDTPEHRDAVFSVVKRLLNVADRYYESAREGIGELPLNCAWAVGAADGVYHSIGDMVIARGAHAWDERVTTPRYRKVYWLMRAGISALSSTSQRGRQHLADRPDDLWMKPEFVTGP